jgi:hypothetical protein
MVVENLYLHPDLLWKLIAPIDKCRCCAMPAIISAQPSHFGELLADFIQFVKTCKQIRLFVVPIRGPSSPACRWFERGFPEEPEVVSFQGSNLRLALVRPVYLLKPSDQSLSAAEMSPGQSVTNLGIGQRYQTDCGRFA